MKIEEGSICPICELGLLKPVEEDADFTYQGHTITFNNCKFFRCAVCGEGLFPDPISAVIDDVLISYRDALHKHFGITPP